jgi:hypothetical protein
MHILNVPQKQPLGNYSDEGSGGHCGLLRHTESNGSLPSVGLRHAQTGMGRGELTIQLQCFLACGHGYELLPAPECIARVVHAPGCEAN